MQLQMMNTHNTKLHESCLEMRGKVKNSSSVAMKVHREHGLMLAS
jgi:hypothetical protein